MASPLASTYGAWLVCIWLQTLLQGCGMLQVWLYFHWYKNDNRGIKAMVLVLLLIETFQSVTFFQVTYQYLIDGFGDFPGLMVVLWQGPAQLFAIYLSAFIVQMYFVYCIYSLNPQNKILPAFITLLAFTQIGSGLAQTILTLRLTSFADIESTKAITTLEASAAFLCDITITVSLIVILGRRKGAVKSTNTILESLTINAINRGMLTALCALINLILFLAIPGTFYFFFGLTLSGKFYMNSALATQHVYSKARGKNGTWNSIQMSNMHSDQSATAAESNNDRVRVVVTKQTDVDSVEYNKKSNFMEGMV
ncbi:hypothetical protein D9619_008588 [Psilocybe cf. subviscida]|uniref:DUF6534 domain-containing protein n=1 Tax=Psilocybe cf. subviscida TaxID=2480587 RepID=A0A8H5BA73_9AGAR|nr:hypothetical protein D9619_008588 [Psilocybe cf. subviscida]